MYLLILHPYWGVLTPVCRPIASVPTVRWYSESDVNEAEEGMSRLLLLMRGSSIEWAWFNQCDVTLHHSLLAAQLVVVCLFVVHVTSLTSVTRLVHDPLTSPNLLAISP